MTNDPTKFNDCQLYNGSGKVVVSNGQSIPISYIGSGNMLDTTSRH
ncbi:hypothetical protein V6Z11_A10G143500 [Gossypium hirsutum]